MQKEVIHTNQAPAAIGPYVQATRLGELVFTSGQIPADEEGNLEQGLVNQITQVMKNLEAIAKAAGTDLSKTVKTTCFLADMGDFATFNEIYATYFTGKPARSCVAVKTLPKNVLVEVDAIIELYDR